MERFQLTSNLKIRPVFETHHIYSILQKNSKIYVFADPQYKILPFSISSDLY